MNDRRMPTRYAPASRALHAAMAVLLPVQAGLGVIGDRLDDRMLGMRVLTAHFLLGLLLVLLLVARILARLLLRAPAPPIGMRRSQRALAWAVHGLMYVVLLVLPASGYVIWVWMEAPRGVFGWFEVPRLFDPPPDDERGRALAWYLHVGGAWLLAALVALHLAAVAWHQAVRRDGLLSRMF